MPRRRAGTGIDQQAGILENMRIKYAGGAVLTGKNEMDNPLLDQITTDGRLEGWTLDSPPEETGFAVYAKGPGQARFTRQDTFPFEEAFHDQKVPLIDGDPLPDVTRQAPVAPFVYPPILELVATAGGVGYAQGWWAWTYAYGVGHVNGSSLLTNCAPLMAFYLNNGEGARVPLPEEAPEGVTFLSMGMVGPFADENAALNATVAYEQFRVPTTPRIPATKDFVGHFRLGRALSFTVNETLLGGVDLAGKTLKKKKKKNPGQPAKKKRR